MMLSRQSWAARAVLLVLLVPAATGCQAGPAAETPSGPETPSSLAAAKASPRSTAATKSVQTKAVQTKAVQTKAGQTKAGQSKAVGTTTASPDDAIDRVLAISVDGLNPRAITQLGRTGAPAFHRLMREGAWTFNARTEKESTSTLPNHTGMLTSRRVDDRRGGHGVTVNRDTGTTVHRAAGRYVSSVFDVVHDRGGRTALFTAKAKFRLFQRTWNAEGARDRVGRDNGRAKIDRVTVDENNSRLVAALNAELRTAPRQFTFLHLALPDEAGHRDGFMSQEYLAAVRQTDRLLGSVLETIADRPALRKQLLVVLTADHGGDGASHTKPSALQNYRVPFMVWGPGVPGGSNLHAMNSTFRSPGNSRPSYSGQQPVRNGDLANLVTDVLDLPKVPGSELNAQRKLNVFRR